MFLPHGTNTARIKKFTVKDHCCASCGSYEMEIKVYRDYYHFLFIPAWAEGDKTAFIRCKVCSEPYRVESLQNDYAKKTRTAFYLYAWPLIAIAIIVTIVAANMYTQWQKKNYIENPQVGDVYLIRNKDDFDSYSFLRVSSIDGDTVKAISNTTRYLFYTSQFNEEDFFVKEPEEAFTKQQLKQMLDSAIINSVDRGYGDEEGFNRVR